MTTSTTRRVPRAFRRPVIWTALLGLQQPLVVQAFHPSAQPFGLVVQKTQRRSVLYSSIGGDDNNGKRRPPPGGGKKDDDGLGDFLDRRRKESADLQRAREYMSETSLPISFDESSVSEKVDDDHSTNDLTKEETQIMDQEELRLEEDEMVVSPMSPSSSSNSSSELSYTPVTRASSSPAATSSLFAAQGADISPDNLAKNPYMNVVARLSPSELISKFTSTANPRVQEAVRSTILGLIGSLPKMAFETTTITTGQRLASLMFQLQMTGYMFKNAEYRLSLSQSLGMSTSPQSSKYLLSGTEEEDEEEEDKPKLTGKVKGKVKIKLGGGITNDMASSEEDTESKQAASSSSSSSSNKGGLEMEVDAQAYLSELRSEVSQLRDELTKTREAKEEAIHKDLLLYIRTLPAKELKSLTDTMSSDVLVCMKGLVHAVLDGIGDGEVISANTVTEQSGEAMAQLCMWQLAVGYNLRELEVREAMKKNLNSLLGGSGNNSSTSTSSGVIVDDNPDGRVDWSGPGVLE